MLTLTQSRFPENQSFHAQQFIKRFVEITEVRRMVIVSVIATYVVLRKFCNSNLNGTQKTLKPSRKGSCNSKHIHEKNSFYVKMVSWFTNLYTINTLFLQRHTITAGAQLAEVGESEGGFFLPFFENWEKFHWFWKRKALIEFICGLNFSFEMLF